VQFGMRLGLGWVTATTVEVLVLEQKVAVEEGG
jgi:hypothetical protein